MGRKSSEGLPAHKADQKIMLRRCARTFSSKTKKIKLAVDAPEANVFERAIALLGGKRDISENPSWCAGARYRACTRGSSKGYGYGWMI